jgi:hypothetical protein
LDGDELKNGKKGCLMKNDRKRLAAAATTSATATAVEPCTNLLDA